MDKKQLDARIRQIAEESNLRLAQAAARDALRLDMERRLLYSVGGHTFRIDQSLLGYLMGLVAENHESGPVMDMHGGVAHIEDLRVFRDEVLSRYVQALNHFRVESDRLKRARTPEDIAS
jgi:hypothetical protein